MPAGWKPNIRLAPPPQVSIYGAPHKSPGSDELKASIEDFECGYSADVFEVSDIVCRLRHICSVLNQETGIAQFKESAIDTPVSRSQITMRLECRHLVPGLGVGLSGPGRRALVCVTRF